MRRISLDRSTALTCLVLLAAGCAAPVAPKTSTAEDTIKRGGGGQTGVPAVTTPATGDGTQPAGTTPGQTQPGAPVVPGPGHAHGAAGIPDGFSHRGEFTSIQALEGVAPVSVGAEGATFTSVDGLKVIVPPGGLTGPGQVRIRRIDNTDRPIMPQKIPGMSFWMDLGGAQIATDQTIRVTGPVDDKFIEELKKRDPAFDPNNYNLSQEDGKWMLTMAMEGPRTTPAELPKITTPYFTTVETADPQAFPVTYFTPEGPLTNTGFKLMGTDGTDHLDGFQTFDDLNIATIREWIEDENDPQYELIDTTKVKTRDANGNPIELDAGAVDPVTGKWKVATGRSSFNPVTHQQNCDFADAGCPDSGAVAKALARYNHVVSTRFPEDYKYPANLVDAEGNPDPRAGQPHPAAGKRKKPPADLMSIVENYRTLGNACDQRGAIRVWAKALWKSDIQGIHLQPATGTNISFAGLEGQAGGEVTVRGRVRPVDSRAMAFETLKGLYNIEGYYNERRHIPSGLIIGPREYGQPDQARNYEANPVKCYIPRYSPEVTVTLLSDDFEFKNWDQVDLTYRITNPVTGTSKTAVAREIEPANPNDPASVPGGRQAQVLLAKPNGLECKPFKFYAQIGESFNYAPGNDPALKLEVLGVKVYRLEGEGDARTRVEQPVIAKPSSLAAVKFEPGTPSSGVWINGRYTMTIGMIATTAK